MASPPGRPLRPIPDLTTEQTIEFWSMVDVGNPDACWPWLGTQHESGRGYGHAGYGYSHRVAFFLSTGEQPGRLIRHTCDNPSCCNPGHLIRGTHKQNTEDMIRRGRQRLPKPLSPEIKEAIERSGKGAAILAKELNVPVSTIDNYRRRQRKKQQCQK